MLCRDVVHGVCRLAPLLPYHYFHDVLLDMHFSGLTYTVLSLFGKSDMHPLDFSLLLNRRRG
ncbi:phage tail assembly protein T [Escherichia coli]